MSSSIECTEVVVVGLGVVVVVVVVVKGMLLDEEGAVLVCMRSACSSDHVPKRLTIATEPAVAVLACDVVNAASEVVIYSRLVMFRSAKAYSGCTHNCCSCRRRRTGCLSLT